MKDLKSVPRPSLILISTCPRRVKPPPNGYVICIFQSLGEDTWCFQAIGCERIPPPNPPLLLSYLLFGVDSFPSWSMSALSRMIVIMRWTRFHAIQCHSKQFPRVNRYLQTKNSLQKRISNQELGNNEHEHEHEHENENENENCKLKIEK